MGWSRRAVLKLASQLVSLNADNDSSCRYNRGTVGARLLVTVVVCALRLLVAQSSRREEQFLITGGACIAHLCLPH